MLFVKMTWALTCRKQRDSSCSYQILVNRVRLRKGRIGSSCLTLGQLEAQAKVPGPETLAPGDRNGLPFAAQPVCRRTASGIWVLGAGPDLGGELDEGGGAPRASAASCPAPSTLPGVRIPSTFHPSLPLWALGQGER